MVVRRVSPLFALFALFALTLAGCQRTTPTSPPSASASAPAAPPPSFAPLGPAPKLERTEDGIPILQAKAAASERVGDVRLLAPMAKTMEWTSSEASDGARTFVGISAAGPDVIVRDGEVRTGTLRALGVREKGCAAARDGEILLSGIVDADRLQPVVQTDSRTGKRVETTERAREQAVFRIDRGGRVSKQVLPPTIPTGDECRLWMGEGGTYTLGTFLFASWDGARFTEDRRFTNIRTTLGQHDGPKLCFSSCNAEERAASPPITQQLLQALGCNDLGAFVALGDWVAGACGRRAVRWKSGGEIEKLDAVPESKIMGGAYQPVLTDGGALVLALDYGYRRYVVWPPSSKTLSPERALARGDVLSRASPTVIVRGLAGTVPDSNTYAVLIGRDIGYGTGGSTVGYSSLRRSPEAHAAQVDRARAVLKKDRLLVAHEAVIDPECGAHVRSPIGWEGMRIHDFGPPTLPKLSPLAVTRKPSCLPLTTAAALPGAPDLLLALSDGELWAAWLPPPLPLPAGSHFGRPPDPTPVVQHPKPGAGWNRLGKADSFAAEDAAPAPGAEPNIQPGTWQYGGAALIRAGGAEIVLTPLGAATLPPGTRPMAVGTAQRFHVWGAIGSKLVDCTDTCRLLDPGVPSEIIGVVPRTETTLLLGYADGRVGVYEVPMSGGTATPNVELVERLRSIVGSGRSP